MEIKTKYSIGDKVYLASTVAENRQHACPDCLGVKAWKTTSPAGGEYTFACPRCSASFHATREVALGYTVFVPTTQQLTIGSFRLDTSSEDGPEYMCRETGVGSGSVYSESRLHPTQAEADVHAAVLAENANKTVPWIAKQYAASLSLCGYQLSSAELQHARDMKARSRHLVEDLFHDLRDCETIAEIKDRIEAGIE